MTVFADVFVEDSCRGVASLFFRGPVSVDCYTYDVKLFGKLSYGQATAASVPYRLSYAWVLSYAIATLLVVFGRGVSLAMKHVH